MDSKWLSGVYTIGMTLGYIDEYISICKGFDILIPIYNWLGIWLLDHQLGQKQTDASWGSLSFSVSVLQIAPSEKQPSWAVSYWLKESLVTFH